MVAVARIAGSKVSPVFGSIPEGTSRDRIGTFCWLAQRISFAAPPRGAPARLYAGGFISPHILWALVIVAPVIALGLHDALQNQHTIIKNFPLLGHGRYLLEALRPEIQQYFIESNIDAFPIDREFRAIAYQRAKGELETLPFGTQRDVYRVGYEWCPHSIAPVKPLRESPRVEIGGPDCANPYSASMLNVSAMSFGALSKNAVLALNAGAERGKFAHNTGEGGISPYHLEPGGDLIWQIGTGYFGCRTHDGTATTRVSTAS